MNKLFSSKTARITPKIAVTFGRKNMADYHYGFQRCNTEGKVSLANTRDTKSTPCGPLSDCLRYSLDQIQAKSSEKPPKSNCNTFKN